MKYYINSTSKNTWIRTYFKILILGISIFLTLGVGGSPVRERSICGLAQCKGDSKKFHYKRGVIYTYEYTVNGTTSIEGGPTDESGLHLSSKVAIKFLTPCDAVLVMKDVQVWQSHFPSGSVEPLKQHHFTRRDSTEETFFKTLQEFSLRFSYADGIIEEICPDPRESVWTLNMKRGLLSSFQNTMKRLDLEYTGQEEDIHGRCKVEYKLGLATSSNLTIERTKDIGSCGDKFGILSSVQGTPYHFGTLHQSMPAVSSTSECEHVVDRNLVTRIRCSETHRLQSLARGVAGAETKILQILNLISVYDPRANGKAREEDDGSLPSVSTSLDPIFSHLLTTVQTDVGKRESLQFRHDYHLSPTSNDQTTAKNALQNFCSSMKDDVGSSSGDSFEILVNILRGLNSTDMMNLSTEAGEICQGDRNLFDDALEAVGTGASVHVIKERILKGEGSVDRINSWIASLTYIPKPDLTLMQSAVDILRVRDKYPEILLTYSTLAHSYCRSKADCGITRPIDILSRLYKNFFLHTNCVTRRPKDVDQILMYLKGIGNFGLYSLGIKDALSKCIHRNDVTEVRVAGIEAYRRMGCEADVSILKTLFENQVEDSEVRIAAFLGLMKCPTYDTFQFVKTILEKEQVHQVGSFVWSYLKNLQETALPSKAEIQGLISDEKFSKKFSTDFRKFSRNLEISTFYDDFNFGIGLDSNWIFSQKSYIPRSAMLNLTIDLFGESINVFEATIRLENFEHYIESIFGPNGKLRNKDIHSIISSFREKRSTPNKRRLKQLALDFDAMRRYNSDPIASVSFKTFGNEILYKRGVGTNDHSKFMDSINPFEYLKKLIHQDTKWEKSKMFLDSVYVIPTGIGLALNLSAKASAILKMDTESEFISENNEFKVKGKLKPSAIVAVMGSMILGTSELQTGIKVKAHLRSSTAIEGIFHMKGREMIEMEFGLPKTQLELLEYKSELIFMEGKDFHVVGEDKRKSPVCSKGILEQVFGVKLCRSSYFNLSPNSESDDLSSPYFPLNGPASFTLSLVKANPELTKTKLSLVSSNNENKTRLEATYGIITTLSTKSLGLTFDMDKINQNFALGIMLPSNELKVSGILRKDHSAGEMNLTAGSNNVQVLNTMISFVKTDEGNGSGVVKPEILIKLYNSRILDGNGTIKVEVKGDRVNFDGIGLVNLEESSVELKVNGNHNRSGVKLVWDAEYTRTQDPWSTKTIKCKSTLRKKSSQPTDESDKEEIDTTLSLDFSEFPDYNLETSWNYQREDERVNSEGEFRMGRGPSWSDRTALKIHHKYQYEESYNVTSRIFLFRVTELATQTDWGIETSHQVYGKSLNSTISLQYAPEKQLDTSLTLVRVPGTSTAFGLGWSLQLPNEKPLKIHVQLDEIAYRVYQGKFEGDWFGRNILQLGMDFVDRTRRQKLDMELKMSIEFGMTRPELLKLRSHIYGDEKESKLSLSSEYQKKIHSWEMGHIHVNIGSKRHRIYSRFKKDLAQYLLTIESGIDENGLEVSIETNLNAEFPDVYAGFRVTKVLGVQTIVLDCKWDASRDISKSFNFTTFLDLSQYNHPKYQLLLTHPGRIFTIFLEQIQDLDTSRIVNGRMSWDNGDQILINGYLKKIQGRNSYELSADTQTPFKDIRNTSLKLKFNCEDEDCLISIDGSWGRKGKVSGLISSKFELLPMESIQEKNMTEDEEVGEDDEESNKGDIDEEPDEEDSSHRRRRRRRCCRHRHRRRRHSDRDEKSRWIKGSKGMSSDLPSQQPYIFSLNSNWTSTIENFEFLQLTLRHKKYDPLDLKTDIDIQLPHEKDLSMSVQWYIPQSFKEIRSTRLHFQIKTPFPNYKTFDLQANLDENEESETLATFGIYRDDSEYSITIRGRSKFDKDGSIGFDITSVPNYDKIFGSLTYAIGDSSRLACQLGWSKVLIGLETGFQWNGNWEEFQVFYTFNSPWEPLKNINILAQIDTSQAEFKFLVNDQGITGNSEWIIETMKNFDIRLTLTSPFTSWKNVGFIAKHSLEEDENEYYSHIYGWVNDLRMGYKLDGGKSEIEEEEVVAVVINSQIEIDTILYPTIRTTFKLEQRESKFNIDLSLLLREGPINVSVELNLLDLFRFNEKVTITSPYPGLFELEINLTPAIIPESNLYNIGVELRWRSESTWQEAGFQVRIGDQKILSDALTNDIADSIDYDEDDEVKGEESRKPKQVIVPESQLLYFHSPVNLLKVFKIEMEKVIGESSLSLSIQDNEESVDDENLDEDNETEGDESDTGKTVLKSTNFPFRTFIILLTSEVAEFNFNIQNEIGEKTLSGQISLPGIQEPISLKFVGKLDTLNSEKKLNIVVGSQLPTIREIQLEYTFQNEKNFLNTRLELHTPFVSWEQQHTSAMYAYNEQKEIDTLNLEVYSENYGKLEANILRSPLSFEIIFNTPIEGYTTLELEASSKLDEDLDDKYLTVISGTIGKEEVFKIDLEVTMDENLPKEMNGTITTTLREYGQGNLEAMMRSTENEVNANGHIQWRNGKLTLNTRFMLQEKNFKKLDLKVTTPFVGYENWNLGVKVPDESEEWSGEDELEDEEEDENLNFVFNIETPWKEFSPINGKAKLTKGSSLLVIKRLALTGKSPKGTMDIMTSWILSDWNSFEIHCDSKYSHQLNIKINGNDSDSDGFTFLSSIPKSNYIKFKIRNFIPNFKNIRLWDTAFHYETENPPTRFGGTTYMNLKDDDLFPREILTLKIGTKIPNSTHNLELISIFDSENSSIDSKLIYVRSPPMETFTSTLTLLRRENSLEGGGIIEWGQSEYSTIQSKFNSTFPSHSLVKVHADFYHPKSQNPNRVIGFIDGTFDTTSGRHKVRIQKGPNGDLEPLLVDLELNHLVQSGLLTFIESSLNITSPYTTFPSSALRIFSKLDKGYHGNFVGNYGNQKASLLYDVLLENLSNGFEFNGTFGIELPFKKQRTTAIQCYIKNLEKRIDGEMKLSFDGIKHIDSTYKHLSAMTQGKQKEYTKILIDNQFWPFGMTRGYQYDYTLGPSGVNSMTKTVRLVEIYDLVHQDLHKLGCELKILTNFNGREITLTGIHPLRSISLNMKYESLDNQFKQNTTFTWAPDSWMGYELLTRNLTIGSKTEEQIEVKINYPFRVITFNSGYSWEGQSRQLRTELDLNSTHRGGRKLIGIINWDTDENKNSGLVVRKVYGIIKHPSLAQDIRGGGELRLNGGEWFEGKFSLDYSGDPKRRVTLVVKTIPTFEKPYYWNLTGDMRLQHSVTNLDLTAFHSNRHLPHELSIITLIDFKNSGKLSQKSKITFELFKQLKKLHLMMSNPDEEFKIDVQTNDGHPLYHLSAETNITGYDPSPKAEFFLDTRQPYFRMKAVHGPDGSDGMYSEGGVIDSRNLKFNIAESYDNFRFSDVNFFLRLNHSKLVTSKLIWRPELLDELRASYVKRMENLRQIWNHQTDKLLFTLSTDSSQVFNQIWENARTTIEPFVQEIREDCDFGKDSEAFSQYLDDALERNDFYMQDVTGLAQVFADQLSVRFSNVFINIREYRREIMGDTSTTELFEKSLLWVLEQAKQQYRTVVKLWQQYKPNTETITSHFSLPLPDISITLSHLFHQCLEIGIHLVEVGLDGLSSIGNTIGTLIRDNLAQHKPVIYKFLHQFETTLYQLLVYVSDFIYDTRDEVMKSPYFQKLTQLAEDIDQLYKDLLENDFSSNRIKYNTILFNFLQKKTNIEQYKIQFGNVVSKLEYIWTKFLDLETIVEFRASINDFNDSMRWLANYTHFGYLIEQLLITLYEKGPELMSQTVLEANAKYQQAKTKFIFDADKGVVEWEQKLPMPWMAFNTPPVLPELPEYTYIMKFKDFFDSSGSSVIDTFYHQSKPSQINWYPPFDGHAMIGGSEYFFTFDGLFYNLTGGCVYLLAGDLVEGNFTVSIEYKLPTSNIPNYNIIVTSSHNTLIIDLEAKTLRDPKRPQNVGLPIQMHYLQGYRDGGNLVVESPKSDFSIVCNTVYRLCQLRVSGWYSRKIGGLLGTMDHERTTDLIHSNGKVASDINDMAKSWDVSDDNTDTSTACASTINSQISSSRTLHDTKNIHNYKITSTCIKHFTNRLSSLQPCYNVVPVDPYMEMCLNGRESSDDHAICLAAAAYIKMCEMSGIRVSMPSSCVKCDLNGEIMIDHDVKVMDSIESSHRSADIVFIVEAKDCNKQLFKKRRIETLVTTMEMEFKKVKLTKIRYAVVTFGGDGVFNQPRSIRIKGELFTEFEGLGDYLNHVHTGNNGGRDIFGAVAHALKLDFQPGASKTLILLPCTSCQPEDMSMDFSTMYYLMLEQGASLHILMHKDIPFNDKKLGKRFFGIDNDVAFTKLDGEKARSLRGNVNLRRQVKVSKHILGYCAPLALQTNGTVFNGKKLQNKREQIVSIFSRLFSRRIVMAAESPPCQQCYCSSSDEEYVGRISCIRCDFQRPPQYNPEADLVNEKEDNEDITWVNGTIPQVVTFDQGEIDDENESEENQNVEDPIEDDYEEYTEGGGIGR